MRIHAKTAATVAVALAAAWPAIGAAADRDLPAALPAGLVVQLGCGDVEALAELAADGGGRRVVQAWDTDPARVDAARKVLRERGLHVRASAHLLTGNRLPYAEEMANAVLVGSACGVAEAELMRILVPRGRLWRLTDGTWRCRVKPWPADIDEWTHWLHGPGCNAVSADRRAGPPRRLKWQAAPHWSRHHHTVPSVTSMVSAGGRVFSIVDQAPAGMGGSAPDKWSLVARDAFNGLPLWEKPIGLWGWRAWSDEWTCRFTIPTHAPRRLVAVGDRVYVTLGFNAPLTELDAATGEVLRTFAGAEFTDEILVDGGRIIVSLNAEAQRPASGAKLRQGGDDAPAVRKSVAAFDADTGRMLWEQGDFEGLHSKTGSMDRITHLSMCAGGGRVYLCDRGRLVALDLADGKTAWEAPRPESPEHKMRYNIRLSDMCSLVYSDGVLYFAQLNPAKRVGWREVRGRLHAFDAATGKEKWNRQCASWGWGHPADVLCLDGLVWVHDFGNPFVLGLDPASGELRRKVSNERAFDNGHHHRCYMNKATERFLITSYRGLEFIDWAGKARTSLNHWVRGVCRYGVMPANGLMYATPHPCNCYVSSKINGFVALAGAAGQASKTAPASPRLVKGDAAPPPAGKDDGADWPTYRGNARRSSSTAAAGPTKFEQAWKTDLGAKPTATTAAGGTVYAATPAGDVVALDARTGKLRWRFQAGGAVDTPPTIAEGLVVFGSADGWAYCLRAADGKLVWRFRGAPGERLIGAFDGIESAWPIHGCAVVRNARVYITAGRSGFLDGGIFACELDLRTGRLIAERTIASDHEMSVDEGHNQLGDTGALDDILVAGEQGIHMRRSVVFGDAGVTGDGLVLRSTSPGGLLADTWSPRERLYLGDVSCAEQLAFDAKSVCGIRARKDITGYSGFFEPGKEGYELFAADLPFQPGKKGKLTVAKRWSVRMPVRASSMVLAGPTLLAAGTPDVLDPKQPWAAYEAKRGGVLLAISTADGSVTSRVKLDAAPVLDGLTVYRGSLIVATVDGCVRCLK